MEYHTGNLREVEAILSKAEAKGRIEELVDRFAYNLDVYKRPEYKEARLRAEFIDPFFEALGWDVRNVAGLAEQYKDVIHEDALKVSGATQAPDYCFRVGGTRKFFVEAKKPSAALKADVGPAYQLRRYAWSAKLPLSILTDFEEFAVYDCRQRPTPADKASAGRVMYTTFDQYLDRFDDIYGVFAKESVLKGSFDRYVQESKQKRGTGEVDAEFLKEIEGWRDALAHNVALRNPGLSVYELNDAVQRTIDRIIFLRICEDRGIESYGRLMGLINGADIYPRLVEFYRQADQKYNAGLFDLRADTLTTTLAIDDRVLKPILDALYYPQSPYEFSVLPADILGQVYEQFLGKVIRLTPAHRAVVEEKPEVKKAGGVYYTPTYIVDYIVQQTVGRLVEGKSPQQLAGSARTAPLRILDPACGSGSFLLGAYQYLLDHYLRWYEANGPEQHAKGRDPAVYRGAHGDWRLTSAEKKRILLAHIYGVDIDRQAVEVTKLSLLLKVLEGEQQVSFWGERALPDLGDNVKCGNSLIGPDYYEGRQMGLFDDEERRRVNAFDWQAEFAQAMAAGGFDAVIGNPPYIRIQMMKEWAPIEVEFYKERYRAASKGNYDIYVVFVERALQLLRQGGRMGYILPHKFFQAKYGEPLREIIAKGQHLAEIVHFGDQQVFSGATTYTCLLFLNKSGNQQFRYVEAHDLGAWRIHGEAVEGSVKANKATGAEWNFVVGPGAALFERLSEMPVKLGDMAHIFVGLQTSADTVFLFKEYEKTSDDTTSVYSKQLDQYIELESDLLKPVIRSGNIGRFWAHPTALVLFPYRSVSGTFQLVPADKMKSDFPKTWDYLNNNKKLLAERERGKFKGAGWYQLYPKNLDVWERPKIMLPYMITHLSAYYDENDWYFVNVTTGGFGITINEGQETPKYMTGLLNSRLLDWFMKNVSTTFHGGYFAANKQFLVQLPIRTIDFTDPADAARHDRMVALVERMLDLHRKLAAATLPADKRLYQRQIDSTDAQIDALVYELYRLTDEEIAIVEGTT
jgi:type I restriction-modification system DNA methylase subunit/predicted type IV restriction endonuclease